MLEKVFEKLVIGALIFMVVLLIGSLAFIGYGHLTQRDTITFEVVNKDIHTATTQSCTTMNNIRTCTPVTTTSYRVYSNGERFSISRSLYDKIVVGKKHTVYVTGWPGSRNISRVLE